MDFLCRVGIHKLNKVVVRAGSGYVRGGVTIKSGKKDLAVKVCIRDNCLYSTFRLHEPEFNGNL